MLRFIRSHRQAIGLFALALLCIFAVPHVAVHLPLALKLLLGGGVSMSVFPSTANDNAILIQYLDDTYALTMIQDRPFYDRIMKKSNVGGTTVSLPLNLGFGGGQGGTFANALANAQPGGGVNLAFTIPPAVGYGIELLQNEVVPFTQTPQSAQDEKTLAVKGAMELACQDFTAKIFSDGFGTAGTISVAVNNTGSQWRLTLAIPTDVNRFNINNVLQSKATPASASLDTGSALVIGTNPLAGIIEVDVLATGMTPTVGHVLGIQGTIAASTSISTFPGWFAWNPTVTSRDANGYVNDTFLGITRGPNTSNVAVSGWAVDGRGKALLPSINNLAGQMANFRNSRPKLAMVNPVMLARLAIEADVKVRYDMKSNLSADVFFMGIDLATPAGHIEVFSDPAFPADRIGLTDPKQWVFAYPDRPFQPSDTIRGEIFIPDFNTNRTRASVTCAGFLYPTNPAAVGNILCSL